MQYTTTVVLCLITSLLFAQSGKRLHPGKMYESGEKIHAPRFGFNAEVPSGWQGMLPMDTEIFLLTPNTIDTGGEIFTFVSNKEDLQSIADGWKQGAKLSESLMIVAPGEITRDKDMISSEVVAKGEQVNKGYKGFVTAKCSPFGPCIISLGIAPVQFFSHIKTTVESFMGNASFTQPSTESIYADFNWKEFLTNKMLIAFMATGGESGRGSKENTFHLCGNGKLKAIIKKKGVMKQFNSRYKGNLAGTWTTESIGEEGILKLNFKKLPSVELPLLIKDEKIFINDERCFAAESDRCDQDK